MIQAFSHIFNFFNIASPCGDMTLRSMIVGLDEILREDRSDLDPHRNVIFLSYLF
jgi:hypothetical protein